MGWCSLRLDEPGVGWDGGRRAGLWGVSEQGGDVPPQLWEE